VGRQGGAQNIELTSDCLGSHSVHHELGHALGLFHQHTRKDRDNFVQVVWANIQGCPSTATQYSDCGKANCAANITDCGCTASTNDDNTCYKQHNFLTDNKRSNIGEYDYDSVMHYARQAFSKGTVNTLDVLLTDASGNPFPIGQRNHLSRGDTAAMRAMYPFLQVTKTIFSGNTPQTICELEGRTEDVAVDILMTGSSPGITTRTIKRWLLPPGDYYVECHARSTFWSDNYNYPNSSVPLDPAVPFDEYSTATTMRIMTPGLIPVLM